MESDPIFTKAIIREVPDTLSGGISVDNLGSTVDLNNARAEHAEYIELIRSTGIK